MNFCMETIQKFCLEMKGIDIVMKKIKILQFPIANSKGGMTRYALENWKWMDKEKFECDFATMSKKLDFEDEIFATGSKLFYISCYAEENRERFADEFRRILTEGKYDIVHLHTRQWKSFLVEQIAKEMGIKKIIVHAHNADIGTLDAKRRREEKILHNYMQEQLTEDVATEFWSCSWKAADFIFGDKIPKKKIRIMNNAIELSKYVYNSVVREEYRKKLGVSDDEYVIGNVGRLAYQKNQEFLLKIFYELRKNNEKKYKLLLVGSGEREKEYKKFVMENGLENDIIFTGQREDVSGLLQAMDLFCLPSRFEGLPISLVEAQASGLPCIVSNLVTEESIMTENAILLPLDINLWKEKIEEYERTKCRRKNMECQLMKNGYDIKTQIKIIEKAYMGN